MRNPSWIEPMLARSAHYSELPGYEASGEYVLAEKMDGFRELMYIDEDGSVRLLNRSGADHSETVPHITGIRIPELAGTVLDGEGIGPLGNIRSTKSVFGSGREHALAVQAAHGDAMYVVFDCIRYKGTDITRQPFMTRLDHALSAVKIFVRTGIHKVQREDQVWRGFQDYYDRIVKEGGEGVMIKNRHAPYEPGKRSKGLLKVKRVDTWDVVITGFTEGQGKYSGLIGAVKYGFNVGGKVVECGQASGMTDEMRVCFSRNRKKFTGKVMELEAQEISKKLALRHPRFVRMRDDKRWRDCLPHG